MFKSPLCWTACPVEGVFVRNEPNEPAKQVRLVKNRQIGKHCFPNLSVFTRTSLARLAHLTKTLQEAVAPPDR